MPYNYNALVESQLRGELPRDVINQIAQRAAERGVATGMPGAPVGNAAYLSAIGRNSLQLQQAGQKAFEEQQRIGLEAERIRQQAAQFAATMTFEEKKLAQALGLSQQEFALQKAKMAIQESQFGRELGESSRRFDVGQGLERSKLGEESRQANLNYSLGTGRLGETAREFDLGLDLDRAREAESARRFDVGQNLNVAGLDPAASFRWSWLANQPQVPTMPAPQYQPPQTSTWYKRPGDVSWSPYH